MFPCGDSYIRAIVRDELSHTHFLMSELKSRMSAADAWPPRGEDLKLTPHQLHQKYSDEIPD